MNKITLGIISAGFVLTVFSCQKAFAFDPDIKKSPFDKAIDVTTPKVKTGGFAMKLRFQLEGSNYREGDVVKIRLVRTQVKDAAGKQFTFDLLKDNKITITDDVLNRIEQDLKGSPLPYGKPYNGNVTVTMTVISSNPKRNGDWQGALQIVNESIDGASTVWFTGSTITLTKVKSDTSDTTLGQGITANVPIKPE